MSKLRSVIRHEYLTIVKQPSFWIVMIAMPAAIAIVGFLVYLGNTSSQAKIEAMADSLKNVAIVDKSELIDESVVESAGLTLSPSSDVEALREEVRTGDKEALIVYPETLLEDRSYQIYLSTNDFTQMGSVNSLGDSLLKTSLFLPLGSAEIISLAQSGAGADVTIYENGQPTAGLNEYIVPGFFVVLFYIIFVFSVGYMLTSVSEEKENRSMEMVLTYVKPRTLIVGKLLAVTLVTLTQVTFFALLALAVFVIALNAGFEIALPFGIDLAKAVFDPMTIFFGAAFLAIGFLMFAGFMTATAAASPSSKEANNFSAVFYIGAFIPFYFITLIVTDPSNPVVQFLTYFPLTSPVITLILNTTGAMSPLEAWSALIVMTLFMMISIWLAVRAFKLGALEFSQTIQFSKLFKKD